MNRHVANRAKRTLKKGIGTANVVSSDEYSKSRIFIQLMPTPTGGEEDG